MPIDVFSLHDLPIAYIGADLDRQSARRKQTDWVAEQRNHPNAQFIPIWRGQVLVQDQRIITLGSDTQAQILASVQEMVFLGTASDPIFAADLSAYEPERLDGILPTQSFIDLRRVGGGLPRHEAALLAYARAMILWHQTHRFCGACGHPAISAEGGHVRVCSNEDCRREIYPRTDPTVIMLVERRAANGQPLCLLGNHSRSPAGIYSTLAGFVEPGESLEEAVAREVQEETGIRVGSVSYQASQPWPFPASIMLGFRALALTDDIHIDPAELNHAGWFTPDQVRSAGEWEDETKPFRLPRRDSIARYLIDLWLADAASAGF